MEPSSTAAPTTTFSAAASSPGAGHLGLPPVLDLDPSVADLFSPWVKPSLLPVSTTSSAPSTPATEGRDLVSLKPCPPNVSDVVSSASGPSYADRVKGAGPSSPPRSAMIFTVAPSDMRVSKANGVSIRASSASASLQDYAQAIFASGVPARQLTDLSRVGGMVDAFFQDSSWALPLIQSGLVFRSEILAVLPIGVAPRSVTVSEVPPWVPDFVIRAVLGRYGTVRGRLRPLPVSLSLPGVGSVRSNRRVAEVTFASPAAFAALPTRETITVNGESLVLRFNEPLRCRRCGFLGHPAKSCPRLLSTPEDVSPAAPDVELPPSPPPPVEVAPESSALLVVPVSATDGPSGAAFGPSSEAMDTANGFSVVSPRRKRVLSPRSFPSSGNAAKRGPLMPPPAAPRTPRASRYLFDPVLGTWRDLAGVFTPRVASAALSAFVVEAVFLDIPDALVLARALVPDSGSLDTLARQVMVFAYTNPFVTSLPAPHVKKRRRRLYLLSQALRRVAGLASESEGTDSSAA